MATVMPQTPQKAFPGAYLNTPAPSKQSSNTSSTSFFSGRATAGSGSQQNISRNPQTTGVSLYNRTSTQSASESGQTSAMTEIERAARTINTTFEEEAKYPAFDNYVSQGYSSEYDIPNSVAWAPFQKIRSYPLPQKIFEQWANAQVSTAMGLFADLHHAWITIDNALYLWDYTNPNPDLIGFEEQSNNIKAVKLVTPKPGVFVSQIQRLLVVATSADIILIGVSMEQADGGAEKLVLYQTRMQVSIRGIDVRFIAGSATTGRIFFACMDNDDIYELTYQQEEKWFQNRCAKINHTTKGMTSILPTLPFTQKNIPEHVVQLVIDDSRSLLYTLSDKSAVRIFSFKNKDGLSHCLTRTCASILSDIGHKVPATNLFDSQTQLVSLNPIPAREASRISLMATTSNGCRIFFSTVSSGYYGGSGDAAASNPPSSMQVYHVKFPPMDPSSSSAPQPPQNSQNQTAAFQQPPSKNTAGSLIPSRFSERLPPGYFLCFVKRTDSIDAMFMSVPDSGRIAHPQDPSQANKFPEFGLWVQLDSRAEDVGQVTAPFSASNSPTGFGNELAVQFDQPTVEIAIMTATGIHTFMRRRLVDIFAATVRYGGGDEGLEGEIKTFVRMYGRGETIATALAVACGQGFDVGIDSRVANITDPEVLEQARKTVIEHGGKPAVNENSVMDQSTQAIDIVRPSPRYEGLALYLSRLLRSVWKTQVLTTLRTVQGGMQYQVAIPQSKLAEIQRELVKLKEFLNTNRTFIEGLAGPEALNRISTKQEETALQGEHQALNTLLILLSNVIEGISFVNVLLGENLDQVMANLDADNAKQVQVLTFEQLFCSANGKALAKELVKAIVNYNITRGIKIETVTDSLRRTCGGFCSPDDCDIFKGQELIKRASDKTQGNAESSRNQLNASLKVLQRVAGSLNTEQLNWNIDQYIQQDFFAGAIQLALSVAQERDRGNSALTWLNDGSPGNDVRIQAFQLRTLCYDKIHEIIVAVDRAGAQIGNISDGGATEKRIAEAYDVIKQSKDEVFQINLYDWYLSQGWSDRLLSVESPFVESYLQRKSKEDVEHADLLWQYYAHNRGYLEAAKVQLDLATSAFNLTLEKRIEYLSRSRANASTQSVGIVDMGRPRQSRQELIREASEYLDVANIQADILQRMKAEPRLVPPKREQVLNALNGDIKSVGDLFNEYVDQAGYHDLSLVIYETADHRNPVDIRRQWQALLQNTHEQALQTDDVQPYEFVCEKVRNLGTRLQLSDSTFSIPMLLPLLKCYAYEQQRGVGSPFWVIDTFLSLSIPYETLVSVLEGMFYANEPPFTGKNRKSVASDIVYVVSRWFSESSQAGRERLFGGEENSVPILELLRVIEGTRGLDWSEDEVEDMRVLKARVENVLRG